MHIHTREAWLWTISLQFQKHQVFPMEKYIPTGLLSLWLIFVVQPEPKGKRPGTYVIALKETDVKQISCGNQYFIKTRLVIIILSIILKGNTYRDAIWQVVFYVFFYIYLIYYMPGTSLNIYTSIIYVYVHIK